jgi:glycosyltransferase involved in cell wall biosynthesis
MMQYASKSLDGMIYHTSTQRGYYQKHFPGLVDKAEFIPFGADWEFFVAGETERGAGNTIVCVGLAKRDWPTLCAAFSQACDMPSFDKELNLKLIGKDSLADIPLAENIKNRVETTPYIPIHSLIAEIRSACFCVLPLEPLLYSLGQMTLLQQMALGKAVIAARVPSLIDYGRDGETLLFYQSGDSSDLAEKMVRLAAGGDLRKRLGESAAASVRNEFSEKAMAERVEEFIAGLFHHPE